MQDENLNSNENEISDNDNYQEQENTTAYLKLPLIKEGKLFSAKAEYTQNSNQEYNLQLTSNCNLDGYTLSPQLTLNNGCLSVSVGTLINTNIGNTNINASGNISKDSTSLTYQADVETQTNIQETEITVKAHIDNDNNDITINAKRPLLKKNNNPISDDNMYQARKEELQESAENDEQAYKYNFYSKVGYKNDLSLDNSFMYMFDKDNFITFDYTRQQDKESGKILADLKKLKFDYKYDCSQNDETKTKIRSVDIYFKGAKNQYGVNFESQKISSPEEENNTTILGASAQFNRSEYGEHQDGLNGALSSHLKNNNNVYGGDISASAALNLYNVGKNKNKDYCIAVEGNFVRLEDLKSLDIGGYGAYRVWSSYPTIIEPSFTYKKESSEIGKFETSSVGLGIYQDLAHEHCQSLLSLKSVYTHTNNPMENKGWDINAGWSSKAGQNTMLNFSASWQQQKKWNVTAGIAVSF